MNKLPSLFFGILAVFASAWVGVVGYSYVTLGHLEPVADENTGGVLPPPMSGLAVMGQRVYAANGCVTCHSQQVRPGYLSTDIRKKLGKRRTVALDYLRERPAFLGTLRIGQDLSNIGLAEGIDANALHRHLYEPAEVVRGSIMPSHRYLYNLRKISGQPSNAAVTGLTGPHAPAPGYEVVPTEDAQALVAYLLSLKRDYPLPEAPEEPAE